MNPSIPPINKGNVTYNSPSEAFFQMPWPRKPLGAKAASSASKGMAKGGRSRGKSRNKRAY